MVSRRRYLQSVGALGLGALAGCNALPFGGDDGAEPTVLTPRVVHASSKWGEAVAVDGDRVVVGAPRALTRTNTFGGAAFVYERDGGEWTKRARLWPRSEDIAAPPEDEARLSFGSRVHVQDGTAVVASLDATAVYWYARDGGAWTRQGARYPGPGLSDDGYLTATDFDGRTFVASTVTREDDLPVGTVHVYDTGDEWRKAAELRRPGGGEWGRYGYAAAVDGDTLAVAATARNSTSPVVHLYERTAAGWERDANLRPEFPAVHAGTSDHGAIAVSGDALALGNVVDEDAARYALVYERDGEGWTRRATLRPDALVEPGAFGETVALDRGTLVATAPRAELDADAGVHGSAFRYDRSGGEWTRSRRYSDAGVVDTGRVGLTAGVSADHVAVGGRIRREDLTDRPAVYAFQR